MTIRWCDRCESEQTIGARGCLVCRAIKDKNNPKVAVRSRRRRAELSALRRCINGLLHDAPTSGVRCDWCKAVHRWGLAAVLANPSSPPMPMRYGTQPATKGPGWCSECLTTNGHRRGCGARRAA